MNPAVREVGDLKKEKQASDAEKVANMKAELRQRKTRFWFCVRKIKAASCTDTSLSAERQMSSFLFLKTIKAACCSLNGGLELQQKAVSHRHQLICHTYSWI